MTSSTSTPVAIALSNRSDPALTGRLRAMGYTDVRCDTGGIQDWVSHDHAIEKS